MSETHELLIFVPELNNRIHFLFRHVFSRIMGIRTIFTNDKEEFIKTHVAKLNYSQQRFENELYIKPNGLLFEKGVRPITVKVNKYKGLPVIFKSDDDSDFYFDIFSAIFYLITRYEEYLAFSPDKHGRFQPKESIAFENGFIEEPIVELWIETFKEFLKSRFPEMEFSECKYHYVPTIDVDIAYSYKNKGFGIGLALLIRDFIFLRFIEFFKRMLALLRITHDPYDNFQFLESSLKGSSFYPIFFFLSGKRGKYDKNNPVRLKVMRKLFKKIKIYANIGLHPSYQSNRKIAILEAEKNNLEAQTELQVTKSRQHYLKLKFPKTFQNLIKMGIQEEYSMGWANVNGFRAGTSIPFHFYDLSRDKETNLTIFPFQAMDTTFKSYLNQTPVEAEKKLIELREKVKKVNGTFVVIWHNDTFSPTPEGKEWRKVFENLLHSES